MKIDVCSIDKCQSELIWNGCAIKRLFESRSEFMAIRHSRLHSGNLKSTCNKYVSIRSKLWNKMLLGAHQNLCSSHFTNHQYSIFRTVRHNEMRHERRLRWAARVDAPNFAHSKKKKKYMFSFENSPEASINESCYFNEQCEAYNFQTECRDGRCTCRYEMTAVQTRDGNYECKGMLK